MYQPEFIRAGRTLDRDEAIRFIVNGYVVTVAIPDEQLMGAGDLRVTITAGTYGTGDSCTYASLPAATRLCVEDLEVYAVVMAAAASLCNEVNAVLLARDLANA